MPAVKSKHRRTAISPAILDLSEYILVPKIEWAEKEIWEDNIKLQASHRKALRSKSGWLTETE